MNESTYNVIDLFCGCGGLSLGFEKAGFDILLGIDVWEDALKTFRHNHRKSDTLCADLAELDPKDVQERIGGKQVDVIIGGPPCQGFSIAGKRIVEDKRNELYKSFVRMVAHFKPKAFVLENVPNILALGEGIVRDAIVNDFTELGYNVTYQVLTASDYGVPQNRRRAVFVGLADGNEFDFDIPTVEHKVTCLEALSDLPEGTIPEGNAYTIAPESEYQKLMRVHSNAVHNHEITVHNEQTQKIISLVPDGGNYKDLPAEYQKTRNVHIAWTRLNSKKPSITIDTGHRHHFHYKWNRVPTVRESARIQSFPDDFVFVTSRTSQYKQVGNAVPPLMAEAIANHLKKTMMSKKSPSFYEVPNESWHRIHFVRPRFKSNIENVLLYMAKECCRIQRCTCDEYNTKYFNAIKMFPGNIDMADKTLNNWRTEIPALFSFYTEDKESGYTQTSQMAKFLNEQQDLTQFLRLFLYSFQFPGGHLKPQDLQDIIHLGIRFKPAKLILQVLMAGNEILSKEESTREMSMSAEEATYCIFNDVRVTSGKVTPIKIAKTILDNRKKHIKYYNRKDPKVFSSKGVPRKKGDVTRYAGDILDYMELANLLDSHNGYFYMKGNQSEAIASFVADKTFFKGYEHLYEKSRITNKEISAIEYDWFKYVNDSMNPDMFKTDISALFAVPQEIDVVFDNRIKDVIEEKENITRKDIGNIGEAIICGHEKMRLKINGYENFVRLVQIVDSPSYHPGFDIDSFEADGTEDHRYIEVKTTISKKKIHMYGFHMSPNEWNVAGTIKEHYCVYRLMISDQSKTLIILRDPVKLYKTDQIEAEPRDGMEISFANDKFEPSELLTWQS